jgi:transcription elongation GreA/GreB family factor
MRARLDTAQIVEETGAGEVGVGSVVDIAGDGGQKMTVEISAIGGTSTVSPTSPLGSALLGKKLGDSVDVQAPKGAWKATITRIH